MKTDDISKALLVCMRIPGFDLEPKNPALLGIALAGGVLHDLLAVELSALGLLTEHPASGPKPFNGSMQFAVNDVHAAAAIVWAVLQRNTLDTWGGTFYFDEQELLWRSIHPRAGLGVLHADLLTESRANIANASEAAALHQKALAISNPRSNEPGS